LKAFQVPLGFWLGARLWSNGLPVLAAIFLGFFGLVDFVVLELWFPLIFLPFMILVCRGWEPWLGWSLAASLVAGGIAWSVYKLAWLLLAPEQLSMIDPWN